MMNIKKEKRICVVEGVKEFTLGRGVICSLSLFAAVVVVVVVVVGCVWLGVRCVRWIDLTRRRWILDISYERVRALAAAAAAVL